MTDHLSASPTSQSRLGPLVLADVIGLDEDTLARLRAARVL